MNWLQVLPTILLELQGEQSAIKQANLHMQILPSYFHTTPFTYRHIKLINKVVSNPRRVRPAAPNKRSINTQLRANLHAYESNLPTNWREIELFNGIDEWCDWLAGLSKNWACYWTSSDIESPAPIAKFLLDMVQRCTSINRCQKEEEWRVNWRARGRRPQMRAGLHKWSAKQVEIVVFLVTDDKC